MAIVVSQTADVDALEASAVHWVFLRVFKNDHTPAIGDDVSAFDEADFDGYSAVGLSWGSPFVNGDGKGQINAASVTWVKGAGTTDNIAYGVYCTRSDGAFMWAERFDTPINMDTEDVSNIYYQPQVTARGE